MSIEGKSIMEQEKLHQFIRRYEEIYFFATRRISSIISEQVLDDMTSEQYIVLRYLKNFGPCKASELADICDVNRSAITGKIDRLVNKGYVNRTKREDDRRSVYLETTEKGDEVYQKGEIQIQEFVKSYLKELTEEELEQFIGIYEKIATIIEKKHGGA